jgi:hypothetical protein
MKTSHNQLRASHKKLSNIKNNYKYQDSGAENNIIYYTLQLTQEPHRKDGIRSTSQTRAVDELEL